MNHENENLNDDLKKQYDELIQEEEEERERGRDSKSVLHWLTPRMAAVAKAEPV